MPDPPSNTYYETPADWWGTNTGSHLGWWNPDPCSRSGYPAGCGGYGYGFSSNRDNQTPADVSVLTWASMDVVAGTTYTWTFDVHAGYGNNNVNTSVMQWVSLGISTDPATYDTTFGTVFTGGTYTPAGGSATTTDGNFSTRTKSGYNTLTTSDWWGLDAADTYTVTYTATTTQTIWIQYDFTIAPRVTSTYACDDIFISLPSVTCQ